MKKTKTLSTNLMPAVAAAMAVTAGIPAPLSAQTQNAAPPAASAAAINVTVNGQAVPFPGQGPVQQGGTVLVPLRGVFEKLGATVRYEAPTKTINAVKGTTTVTLRLGEATAFVNGVARPLSVPAAVTGGTTLVPLRFVSEALGAQVKWEATSRVVQIVTGAQGAGRLPEAPATDSGTITGTITGVFTESNTLTLRVAGGANTRISLTADTVILARVGQSETGQTVALNALQTGDQASVKRDASGNAAVVEVLYDERRGEVKSIQPLPATGGYLVTLTNGTSVEIVAGAPVMMSGNAISLSDIKPGEKIVIRINPQTKQGLGVSVGTGDNPNPTPLPQLSVNTLNLDVPDGKVLRAGDDIGITLTGTPGAKAAYTIPGLPNALNQPLTESSPGSYTGAYKVPEGVSVKGATLSAQLTLNDATSEAKQSAPITIDAAGPVLSDLSPVEKASVVDARPLLYGTYSDVLSGVDAKGTRLLVNGRDVTAQATITPAFFSYRPAFDLPVGDAKITLIARDTIGNQSQQDWIFTVTPAAKPITLITVSPLGQVLGAGDVLQVRVDALPGGTAKFAVGGAITERALSEEQPGTYSGFYTVKKGDSLTKAPVTITFTPKDGGQTFTQTAPQSVTIAAGAPIAPIIDLPLEGSSVGGGVVLSGRAAPNTTVRVSVKYAGRLLILSSNGTAANLEVKVGTDGRWQTPQIDINPPLGSRDITYTAEVVVITASGEISPAATVRFKK